MFVASRTEFRSPDSAKSCALLLTRTEVALRQHLKARHHLATSYLRAWQPGGLKVPIKSAFKAN